MTNDSVPAPRLQAPKGTYDLLPPRSEAFARVVDTYADAARRAGYGYVSTPVFEDTALFRRGVGEAPTWSARRCTPSRTAAAAR